MKCALCKNESADDFDNVSFVDAKSSDYLLVCMCCHCGLVQQSPIPSSENLKAYYSHNYRKEYKSTYTPKPKHIYRAGQTAKQRLTFMKKSGMEGGSLLDVGAGGGEFVYLSSKLGFQSKGIEPNIRYSEYAGKEYRCNVATGTLEDISGTYDLITIFHVLEHLPAPILAFKKLYEHLNHKGKLFVEVPWLETKDASPNNIYFKAHIFYFSIDTLIACASPFFDVLRVDTSSNLKVIFEAKTNPENLTLPSTTSIQRIRTRLKKKSWFEYLTKGKGYTKPVYKIKRSIEESKFKEVKPKKILESIIF